MIYGDFFPTGFGRICRHVAQHLTNNKYELLGACVQWDGILPLQPASMPFHVCALSGRDQGQGPAGLANVIANVVSVFRPDVLISVQDFPYHEALRAARIDWSVMAHVVITPVDGVPVAQRWLDLVPQFDAFMTISEFGVKAFKEHGLKADLCPPGVDMSEFFRLPDSARGDMRDVLSIPHEAFVVGAMAMNQGRKDFPSMIRAFSEAFRDEPNAYLYLDCERMSPMGWDIPGLLLKGNKLDEGRVRFREDAVKAGLMTLNARYNLLDLHMVTAHREGYGLPHGEAMATGIPSVALDYCSASEIIGANERGYLIPAAPTHPGAFGTWGGALDYWPDMKAFEAILREAFEKSAERKARGERALEWVKTQRSWDRTGKAVENVLERVWARRSADFERKHGQPQPKPPVMPTLPAGVHVPSTVFNVNGPIFVQGTNADSVANEIAAKVGKDVQTVAELMPLVESKGDAD